MTILWKSRTTPAAIGLKAGSGFLILGAIVIVIYAVLCTGRTSQSMPPGDTVRSSAGFLGLTVVTVERTTAADGQGTTASIKLGNGALLLLAGLPAIAFTGTTAILQLRLRRSQLRRASPEQDIQT